MRYKLKTTMGVMVLNLSALMSIAVFGQADSTKHSAKAIPQPKLEVTSTADGVITGSYTAGGRTIYFEAIRGEANVTNDPDAPPYGMDIRVMDGNHTSFLMQSANSTPLSNSWANDGTEDNAFGIDPAQRLGAFRMLPVAARALKNYLKQSKGTMSNLDQSDLLQLIALLESVRADTLYDSESALEPETAGEALTATYTHKTYIFRKDAWFNGSPGDHSAVLLRIYSSGGSLVRQWRSCNHGTCADQSPPMYAKCFRSFLKGNTSIPTPDRACDQFRSPYVVRTTWPYTIYASGHVCNNDTRQQYLSIKGSSNINWGICSFNPVTLGVLYRRAPDCD